MQHLHVLAVDTSRRDTQFLEQFPALLRQPAEETDFVLAAAEIFHHCVGEISRDFGHAPVAGFNAPLAGECEQFRFVTNFVAAGLAGGE